MLETICAALFFDAALIIIALLFCRATGTRLPSWIGPKMLVDFLNRLISPDPKRFAAVFG